MTVGTSCKSVDVEPDMSRYWRIIDNDGVLHLAHAHYPAGTVICGDLERAATRSAHDRGNPTGAYERLCWICELKSQP